jgi:hypothetical protein
VAEKPKTLIRRFALTVVLAAAALFACLPRGNGFCLALVFPLVAVWSLYTVVRMGLSATGRSDRAIRFAIWAVVLLVSVEVQEHWETSARDAADKIVNSLAAYKAQDGVFPDNLSAIGVDEQSLSADWGLRYRLRGGKPELSYPASLMPLSSYEYDFGSHRWQMDSY